MRRRINRRTFLVAGLGATAAAFARRDTRPDTILHNGRILTMGASDPEVEALAVAGSRAAPGSDYTASPAEPMQWLRSEVTRTDAHSHTWGANQRIRVEEAIRCSTVHGAYASFEEDIKGSLEPGRLADLVVWDHDLLTIDPMNLMSVKAERTMLGGRWVYEA